MTNLTSTELATIAVAALGGGGAIVALITAIKEVLLSKTRHQDEMETRLIQLEKQNEETHDSLQIVIEGLSLGLQSDKVIFEALRTNHINGESEKMDDEIDGYLFRQMKNNTI